jgi:hypothetical protein
MAAMSACLIRSLKDRPQAGRGAAARSAVLD